ncbi:hypothetical protein [Streptomyces parvulus]|uniref:Uncharacterized protein n=1 Tax=Streptomyces parvulus TaxID=146923 RepID=A0A369UW98_9ACTN|nr:hypothetical protein [Streptomyces parvulus]RDD85052.1 hypothetical protein DVZ84_31405 [Streptomyces parvulus]
MTSAPVVVHRPSPSGGRRVTLRRDGHDMFLGTAHSDHDLVVFLEGAGIDDAARVLDRPQWVEWRDGLPHDFRAP